MRDISPETKEHCTKTHVEILVSGNRVLIFQGSGEDVVDQLVAQLQELGLKLEEEFNSPCG
jgi:pyruvate/oxaloacetate carboxyltransferase